VLNMLDCCVSARPNEIGLTPNFTAVKNRSQIQWTLLPSRMVGCKSHAGRQPLGSLEAVNFRTSSLA
jgi:hypothetical protein